MPDLKPMEPGVMFWAGRDEVKTMASLGVRCGQLAVPGDVALNDITVNTWKLALEREGFDVITVFAVYDGEDYADIPTVQRTVGFIPPATRAAREQRTCQVSDFAKALGVGSIACHIGCVPEDASDAGYIAVREVVRRVCDHAARNGQTFALETGQERAEVLLAFIRDVDRPNLRINFDPANMILYGSGDPIDALRMLAPYVVSVHAKDGDWPPHGVHGALGKERPLGQGSVGIERLLAALREIGFRGPLNVEREAEDSEERLRDMRSGVELLRRLTASAGAAERT
jgi:sugar phosphate isomerase/epimerase